jgi:cytochrome P450
MTAMEGAARVFADPTAYTDEVRLHAALSRLRTHAPVTYVDAPGYRPFWAISRHADVMAVERANELFINAPRPLLLPTEEDRFQTNNDLPTLIRLDEPRHRQVRAVGANWFRPKALRNLKIRVDELARIHVDKMRDIGTECDFVDEVVVNYPLFVIMSLLGMPEEDFPHMLAFTYEYSKALTAARREQPTEDFASAIANARIDGQPLSDNDTWAYHTLIVTAGHETTSATIAGGIHALAEHPTQRDKLRDNRALLPSAIEEMIRWVTPVKTFMRTATSDTAVRGVPIKAGDSVLLSYVSANRDEGVFADPFRFDVARDPNKHLAFGHGVHVCLGAALARMEISSFFTELLPRLEQLELNGEPELTPTTFVGGLKRLPIRYVLK